MMAGSPISWSSKKQPTVALSSMEGEYMALCHASKEVAWLRSLMTELGYRIDQPTNLITDNETAISFSTNPIFHSRSKHIDIRHHFVRELIATDQIKIFHCASDDNLADIFTKPLNRPDYETKIKRMGMISD